MTVYVDDMFAPYRGMKMVHMVADSTEELLAMARTIGVNVKWIQKKGTPREHFDICASMRAKAVAAGAVQITWRECSALCWWRQRHPHMPRLPDPKTAMTQYRRALPAHVANLEAV